jgi:uncharacterized protein
MCFGIAHIIDDPEEKSAALNRMIDRFYPERSCTLRASTELELKATTVIGMTIEQASAKIRAKDALPIYAAWFPVSTVMGEVEPCPRLLQGVLRPPGLAGFTPGRRLDEIMLKNRERAAGHRLSLVPTQSRPRAERHRDTIDIIAPAVPFIRSGSS